MRPYLALIWKRPVGERNDVSASVRVHSHHNDERLGMQAVVSYFYVPRSHTNLFGSINEITVVPVQELRFTSWAVDEDAP